MEAVWVSWSASGDGGRSAEIGRDRYCAWFSWQYVGVFMAPPSFGGWGDFKLRVSSLYDCAFSFCVSSLLFYNLLSVVKLPSISRFTVLLGFVGK